MTISPHARACPELPDARWRSHGAVRAAGLAGLLLAAGCVSTTDWRDVRLVRDRADVAGCTLLTILKDNDMNDLRRRAMESGGDTVFVTGSEGGTMPVLDPSKFVADVYRCRPQG